MSYRSAMLSTIVAAIGTACGGEVVVQSEGEGGTRATGKGGADATSSSAGSTSSFAVSVVSATTTTGGGACQLPVIEPPSDALPIDDCTSQPGPSGQGFEEQDKFCLAVPAGESCATAFTEDCLLELYSCGLQQKGSALCGPYIEQGECCFVVLGDCPIGRPFTVAGRARHARPDNRSDWHATFPTVSLASLSPTQRARLAEAWTAEALAEHASVASFARFLLQLLAQGAPADLVAEAQVAIDDERRHAEGAFAWASRFAGRNIGPGRLDVTDALGPVDRRSIASSTAAEGAIAETVSAAIIFEASCVATEPALRTHLARVAQEEQAHAVLAWRTLRWLLSTDSSLRDALAEVFANAEAHVGLGPIVADDTDDLEGWGYLSARRRRIIACDVLREVVAPSAEALLASAPSHAARA